ncbi:glycosyltransferase [bacterium]|nr:glycosyltransferase [bacterium]
MNILFFADASDIHTKRWVSWYRDRGYRVDVISFLPAEIEGVTVHHINAGKVEPYRLNFKYVLHLWKVARVRMRIRADIVMAHYIASYGVLAALFCRHFFAVPMGTDVKVIPHRHMLLQWMTRFVLKRAQLIFSTAQHITADLTGMSIPSEKIVTLQYGINGRRFAGSARGVRDTVCLSSRALKRNSNVDVIIRACALAAQTFPELRLIIAGDGPERAALHREAAALTGARAPEFRGMMPEPDLAELLKKSLIFISLTSSDGAPLSLLEAMYAGCICIASDIPAHREWLRDGESGFLCPVDAVSLAGCISTVFALDEESRTAMRQAAAETVNERGLFINNMRYMENRMCSFLDPGISDERN